MADFPGRLRRDAGHQSGRVPGQHELAGERDGPAAQFPNRRHSGRLRHRHPPAELCGLQCPWQRGGVQQLLWGFGRMDGDRAGQRRVLSERRFAIGHFQLRGLQRDDRRQRGQLGSGHQHRVPGRPTQRVLGDGGHDHPSQRPEPSHGSEQRSFRRSGAIRVQSGRPRPVVCRLQLHMAGNGRARFPPGTGAPRIAGTAHLRHGRCLGRRRRAGFALIRHRPVAGRRDEPDFPAEKPGGPLGVGYQLGQRFGDFAVDRCRHARFGRLAKRAGAERRPGQHRPLRRLAVGVQIRDQFRRAFADAEPRRRGIRAGGVELDRGRCGHGPHGPAGGFPRQRLDLAGPGRGRHPGQSGRSALEQYRITLVSAGFVASGRRDRCRRQRHQRAQLRTEERPGLLLCERRIPHGGRVCRCRRELHQLRRVPAVAQALDFRNHRRLQSGAGRRDLRGHRTLPGDGADHLRGTRRRRHRARSRRTGQRGGQHERGGRGHPLSFGEFRDGRLPSGRNLWRSLQPFGDFGRIQRPVRGRELFHRRRLADRARVP